MSSTNKTSLGLNMWEASDKPVRQDFLNDNTIIDEKITQLNSNLDNVNANLSLKVNASDIMREVYSSNIDLTSWVTVSGVTGGSVYFFLLTLSGTQYLCPIYVATTAGVTSRFYIDGTTYLSIESQLGYVNARLSGNAGTLIRVYRVK